MTRAFVALGSNLGSREQYLLDALNHLHRLPETVITALSPVYSTKPLGTGTDLPFFNMCAELETGLTAHELLHEIKSIEKQVGRIDRARWAEREIDIDIVLFGSQCLQDGNLKIPHPGLLSRDFVLVPLLAIDNDLKHPETNYYLRNSLAELDQLFIEELLLLQFTILENEIILIYG